MDVALYQRARAVFEAVADLPPSERAAAVREACDADADVEALVFDLLRFDTEPSEEGRVGEAMAAVQAEGRDATAPVPLQPGVSVDRYTVLRLLGVGGTAQVWAVRHRTLGTDHALKVLTWADPGLQRRLLREARTQAALDHPHIVPVHDIIEVNGAPGLLMPLIGGPALDELLAEQRPTLDEAVALLRAVAAAVGHAHARGFAHRDLKPGNVLIELQGDRLVPRVADFGLVKDARDRTLTIGGTVMGTLNYAAPEQLGSAANADARSDLWSLGVMLVELATGDKPFRADGIAEMLERHAEGVDLSGVPEAVRAAAEGALRLRPEDRLADCAALLAALPEAPPIAPASPFAQAARRLAEERAQARSTVQAPRTETWRPSTGGGEAPGSAPSLALAGSSETRLEDNAAAAPVQPARRWGRWAAAAALAVGGWALWPGPEEPTTARGTEAVEGAQVAVEAAPEGANEDDEAPAPPPEEAAAEAAPAAAAPPPPASPASATTARQPSPRSTPAEAAPPAAAAPAEPEPPTPGPPAPEPEPAQVFVSGPVEDARLLSADGRVAGPGAVPPGRYTFEARLPRGNLVTEQIGQLSAGDRVTIRCSDEFALCSVTRL